MYSLLLSIHAALVAPIRPLKVRRSLSPSLTRSDHIMDLDRVARRKTHWYQSLSLVMHDRGLVRGCWKSLLSDEPPSVECKKRCLSTSVVYQPSNGLPCIGHPSLGCSMLLQNSKLVVDVPFHLSNCLFRPQTLARLMRIMHWLMRGKHTSAQPPHLSGLQLRNQVQEMSEIADPNLQAWYSFSSQLAQPPSVL
jgi:hypothetical protein